MSSPTLPTFRPLELEDDPPRGPLLRCLLFATLLTGVFWGRLWTGGSLVSDEYLRQTLPQQQFVADELRAGRLPLWNHLAGHGYPILGEGRTGLFYPPHLLLLPTTDITTATTLNLLGHYVLAFVAAWAFVRQWGLSEGAALLAALVYVYGWFPVRIGNEAAIVGGAWLPVVLYACEAGLRTGRWRFPLLLSTGIGLQWLAGDSQLPVITLLLAVPYLACRLRSAPAPADHDDLLAPRLRAPLAVRIAVWCLAIVLGLLMAAIQFLPGQEFRSLSGPTPGETGIEASAAVIPMDSWLQLLGPWWYLLSDGAVRETEGMIKSGVVGLYAGVIPIWLAIAGLLHRPWRRAGRSQGARFWWGALALSLVLSTGWLSDWLPAWPGPFEFQEAAWFSVVVPLAIGILAAQSWDAWSGRWRPAEQWLGVLLVMAITAGEFWWLSTPVTENLIANPSPLAARPASPVREQLLAATVPVRLLAPDPNLGTLLGVAATPVSMSPMPMAYTERGERYPVDPLAENDSQRVESRRLTRDRLRWLREHGVTHLLAREPLGVRAADVPLIWFGEDPFLNGLWRRSGQPVYLYGIQKSVGRVHWMAEDDATGIEILEQTSDRIRLHVTTEALRTLVWEDLAFPGWEVLVDGALAESSSAGLERRVRIPPGEHEVVWCYRPWTVYCGALISAVAVMVIASVGHVRFWYLSQTERVLQSVGLLREIPR